MTYDPVVRTGIPAPVFSTASLVAIGCAIGSFFVSPGLALLLAIAAAIFGVIGCLVALSPTKRGGILSLASIAIGGIAIVISIVRFIL